MSYLVGSYITKDGLKNIKNHKYTPGVYAPIDNLLNPFWVAGTEFLPMWMAPNLVTLIGLILLVASYLWMLFYDRSFNQPLPQWTYLVMAFGVFAFQTLDAMDGKQARRTNSSSPLGQLFDHGCDALNWVIIGLNTASLLQTGGNTLGILTVYAASAGFYFTVYLEYYSDVFEYTTAMVDGTTGQVIIIIFNLVGFFGGGEMLNTRLVDSMSFLPKVIFRNVTFGDVGLFVVVYVGILFCTILMYKCIQAAQGTQNKIRWVFGIIHYLSCYVLLYFIDTEIPWIRDNIAIVYICILLLHSIMNLKLNCCRMGKMEFDSIHPEFLILIPFFYMQSKYDGSEESLFNLKITFYLVFTVLTLLMLRFAQTAIQQLTAYLGITCFTIENKKTKKE